MTFAEACRIFKNKHLSQFSEASEAVVAHSQSERRLSVEASADLALAIAESGEKVMVPNSLHPLADCPSTGGPSSLTTLLCPLLIASVGIRVPKLSATGSTAGGIDTMEMIPGFDGRKSGEEFIAVLEKVGIAHARPSEMFCPADNALIECRQRLKGMRNVGLAAASLLAKKIAIPGTVASLDCRIGPTGNICDKPEEAGEAAQYFMEVAKSLGVPLAVTLTDNRSFPCSALGRLESLDLLWKILNTDDLELELDKSHVETCIAIAAQCCMMTGLDSNMQDSKKRLQDSLFSGQARTVFLAHLKAQGASLDGLHRVIEQRREQSVITVAARDAGFWRPPDIAIAKEFVKAVQGVVWGNRERTSSTPQIGLRLLVDPSVSVAVGQPLFELRLPPNFAGECSTSPLSLGLQILGTIGVPSSIPGT